MPRAAPAVFGWARMLVLEDAREGVLGSAALRGIGGWPAVQKPSLPCALSISMLVMRRSSSSSSRLCVRLGSNSDRTDFSAM